MEGNKVKAAGAALIATMLMIGGQVSATHFSEDNADPNRAEEIYYDQMARVTLSENNNDLDLYKFVPKASGKYTIWVGDIDEGDNPYISLADSSGKTIGSFKYLADGLSSMEFDLTKGNSYYIVAWTQEPNSASDYTVSIIYYKGSGNPYEGWRKMEGDWYYNLENGSYAKGWTEIGGKWYYFNDNGIMQTGWQDINGKWY